MAKKLTDASLEKLRADPVRRLEIPDGMLPGLYFVIQPSGARSWAVRYRADGKPRKLTLGPYPAIGLADARKAAQAALIAASKGDDPAATKQEARRTAKAENLAGLHRFENVARTFITRYAKGKNRSWRETARLLGLVADKTDPDGADDPAKFIAVPKGIVRKWTGRDIRDIRKAEIVELLDSIVDRGSPIVSNRTLAALRRLFNWATERGLVDGSPCGGVKAPSAETSRDRVLSDHEIRWFWAASGAVGFPFGQLARLLLLTGQRRDEVAAMIRGEIDGNLWTIPKHRAKNGQAHAVPLSDAAIAEIASTPRIEGPAGFIFTTTGVTSVSGFSRARTIIGEKMLEAARSEARDRGEDADALLIPHWTFHDLRRTAASGMASLGIAVHVVEKLLNHRSGTIKGVAAVYNRHEYEAEKRQALEAWARFITLLTDAPRWARYEAWKAEGDRQLQDGRNRAFKVAILEGGTKWEALLAEMNGAEPDNVIPLWAGAAS